MIPLERVIADMAGYYSMPREDAATLLARALHEPVDEPLQVSG